MQVCTSKGIGMHRASNLTASGPTFFLPQTHMYDVLLLCPPAYLISIWNTLRPTWNSWFCYFPKLWNFFVCQGLRTGSELYFPGAHMVSFLYPGLRTFSSNILSTCFLKPEAFPDHPRRKGTHCSGRGTTPIVPVRALSYACPYVLHLFICFLSPLLHWKSKRESHFSV